MDSSRRSISCSANYQSLKGIEIFDVDPNVYNATTLWIHWCYTFKSFLRKEYPVDEPDDTKLKLLSERLSPTIFEYIWNCNTYKDAMNILNNIYMRPRNEMLSRYILKTRKQLSGESIADYIRALKLLAEDCNFKDITAEEYANETIRDTFIAGTNSIEIKQHLLNNLPMNLDDVLNIAISVENVEARMRSNRSSMSNPDLASTSGSSEANTEVDESRQKRFSWNKLREKINKSCLNRDP
jgi:hypothetical protein